MAPEIKGRETSGPSKVQGCLSIGATSSATGLPRETLRAWERRYGFPMPERTGGGHRLYRVEVVERLRWLARAVDAGHRPGEIVRLGEEELRALVGEPASRVFFEEGVRSWEEPSAEALALDWVRVARAMDSELLLKGFERAWYAQGVREFLETYATKFLRVLASGEREGRWEARHADFARTHLRDFLIGQWRPLSTHNRGPLVVCAPSTGGLEGPRVHMAAVLLALSGCKVMVTAGREEELEATVRQLDDVRALLLVLEDGHEVEVERVEAWGPRLVLLGTRRAGARAIACEGMRELAEWAPTLLRG